jgi:RimJ/RimL family protein N-acetyltransferase
MTAMVPHPYTIEVAEGWILFALAQLRRQAAFTFLMEARDGSGVVGSMGVFRRRPDADWEVGYYVAKPAWGCGYASEALAAVVAWTRSELRAPRLVAGHFDDNPASRRVLEKAGFAPTGASTHMYSIARGAKARSIDMALDLYAAA